MQPFILKNRYSSRFESPSGKYELNLNLPSPDSLIDMRTGQRLDPNKGDGLDLNQVAALVQELNAILVQCGVPLPGRNRKNGGGRKRRSIEDKAFEMRWCSDKENWSTKDWLPVYRACIPGYRKLAPLAQRHQEKNLREAVRKRKLRDNSRATK